MFMAASSKCDNIITRQTVARPACSNTIGPIIASCGESPDAYGELAPIETEAGSETRRSMPDELLVSFLDQTYNYCNCFNLRTLLSYPFHTPNDPFPELLNQKNFFLTKNIDYDKMELQTPKPVLTEYAGHNYIDHNSPSSSNLLLPKEVHHESDRFCGSAVDGPAVDGGAGRAG
jgi:hypothetical protein